MSQPATKRGKMAVEAVHPNRIRQLSAGKEKRDGPVVYWMSRDQRVEDNYALLHARDEAVKRKAPLAVLFCLVNDFLNSPARHYAFMLDGLKEVEKGLKDKNIPFFLRVGSPAAVVSEFVESTNASLLVSDYSPLRISLKWRAEVKEKIPVQFDIVDAHNVVPVWIASDKQEVAARTFRPKISHKLPEYMTEFPPLEPFEASWDNPVKLTPIPWDTLLDQVKPDKSVPAIDWAKPGAEAAMAHLKEFVTKRLGKYATDRNTPHLAQGVSGMSPWLHFGQIAPQRCAMEANKMRDKFKEGCDAFVEELVVRRELSDNYCHYNQNYDSIQGAAGWAQETLRVHTADKREFLYTLEQFEQGKTHDDLWNAAQLELVHKGKMHGFMRMYWAKKILEWTPNPETALRYCIYLNDRYSIDGRDPNGYVGCMWSICGIHDMGWTERTIFGKIRYMNYNGCKRKFDIGQYVAKVKATKPTVKSFPSYQ